MWPLLSSATHGTEVLRMVRAYVLITATAGKALDVVERLRTSARRGPRRRHHRASTTSSPRWRPTDIAGIGRLVVERVQSSGVLKTITCLAVQ